MSAFGINIRYHLLHIKQTFYIQEVEICGSRCDSIVKKKRFTVRLKGQEGGFQKFSACSHVAGGLS